VNSNRQNGGLEVRQKIKHGASRVVLDDDEAGKSQAIVEVGGNAGNAVRCGQEAVDVVVTRTVAFLGDRI